MQRMKFRGLKLFYGHRESADSMVRQIDDFPAFFTPRGERPLIIDCGANIGVSVLEWKTRWPQSQVLCFEPDPFAFSFLQRNVDENGLPGVRCIEAAVSDQDGEVTFYGEIAPTADARGNSIDPAWGNRIGFVGAGGSTERKVACRRLSTFIGDREVSFLKLDVEGAESRVLSDIAPQLEQIDALYVEVHETAATVATNNPHDIERQLRAAGFQVEYERRFHDHALPAHLTAWQHTVRAKQTQMMAWR